MGGGNFGNPFDIVTGLGKAVADLFGLALNISHTVSPYRAL